MENIDIVKHLKKVENLSKRQSTIESATVEKETVTVARTETAATPALAGDSRIVGSSVHEDVYGDSWMGSRAPFDSFDDALRQGEWQRTDDGCVFVVTSKTKPDQMENHTAHQHARERTETPMSAETTRKYYFDKAIGSGRDAECERLKREEADEIAHGIQLFIGRQGVAEQQRP